ncbi:polymerase delta-interacting protein 3 isoform X2 [Hemitrygon akajei]|uniref:polymerase delta-interacting protein 3 isoform X2 n=1 Tax=Hemitrygon akajei TaxID=2704970 RepID=UPI003BF9AF19
MADSSLDDIIRRRGLRVKGRPLSSPRPVVGGVKSRIGDQFVNLSTSWPASSFQRTFDARQKIGITDARQRLTMRDARDRLGQKDMRSKITGGTPKVLDAREMINSRKNQDASEKGLAVKKVLDARERLSARRSAPAVATAPASGTINTGGRITKTIQVPQKKSSAPVLSHPLGMQINVVNDQSPGQVIDEEDIEEEEEDHILRSIPMANKTMKVTTTVANNFTQKRLNLSPLEGTKMTVNNLHPRVTEEDIVELFCVCGALKRARLVHPGVAEVVFVRKDDAITAYKKYNNRCLDGQPMKCNLHMNGNVITSEQPILLRLSDSPVVKKPELPRVKPRPSNQPPAEVDPEIILKALFKSSGPSTSAHPTAFKIKL